MFLAWLRFGELGDKSFKENVLFCGSFGSLGCIVIMIAVYHFYNHEGTDVNDRIKMIIFW